MPDVQGGPLKDILPVIFQSCDMRGNYRNALVSRTWSEEAQRALWHRLPSLKPLLSLLSPLVEGADGKYVRRWALYMVTF